MKKRELLSLLLSASAAVTMISGCSDDPTPEPFPSGSSDISNSTGSFDEPNVTEGPSGFDELPPGIKDMKDELSEQHSIISLVPGTLNGQMEVISEEEGEEIDRLIFEDEQRFLASSSDTAPLVKIRDWSRYTCLTAKEKLSFYEAVFYDRLDRLCRTFLEEPSHGAVKMKDHFFLNGVEYGDLGLTSSDAADVYMWFRYNNPQYYFLDSAAVSAVSFYPTLMDFVMELSDAAETTNTMFDKLDSWIEECSDDETAVWQKICSINQKICEAVIYDPKVLNKDNKLTREEVKKASGGKNLTIYSVLMSSETVSAGYGAAFSAMANAMGIDSLVTLSSTHVWNTVKFDDGYFYCVDVCRNDIDDGYTENWIGVGSQYVSLNDRHNDHVYRTIFAKWCPVLSDSSYNATVNIPAPEPEIAGSGSSGIKVQWNTVEGADRYYVAARDENDYIVQKHTKDPFMYIPYADGSENLTVYVCARCEKNGVEVSSEFGNVTCSHKDGGAKPEAPSNISSFFNDYKGLTFQWDSSVQRDVFFCFGNDSTFSKISYSYGCEKEIGFANYDLNEETYFAVASISEGDGAEILSDPYRFSYSNSGGLNIISENGATDPPEGFTANAVYTDSGRAVECSWDSVSGADGYEFVFSSDADFSHIDGGKLCEADDTFASCRISDKSEHLYFRVRTINGSGDSAVYSEWTAADTVIPEIAEALPQKPAAPAKIWTAIPKEQFVTFSWDKVWGADGYTFIIYSGSDYRDVRATYNSTDIKITVGRFEEGETYYCGIQSVSSQNGRDVYSACYRFSFVFDPPTDKVSEDIEKPKNITISFGGDSATFNWDTVQGASGYEFVLYNESDYTEVKTEVDASENTATVGGFIKGEKYFFGIRTVVSVNGENIHSPYAWFSFTFQG